MEESKLTVRRVQPIDLAVLYDLYRYRALSTQHIMKRHFSGGQYGYRKIYILKNSGYISNYTYKGISSGKRAAYYRITDKGINVLLDKKVISKPMRAFDLQVSKERLSYLKDVNTIMVELSIYGWQFKDSRQVKAKYILERGSLIQGLFISPDDKEYSLYLIAGEAEEKTVNKVLNEIKNLVIGDSLVFVKSIQSYQRFKKLREQNNIINQSIHLLPYSDYSFNVLQKLSTKSQLVKYFTSYLQIKDSPNPNFDYLTEHEGEEKYLVNLMTNDLMRVFRVKKFYTLDRYQSDGRKVLLASPLTAELEEEFRHYPHVSVLQLPDPTKAI